MEEEKDKLDLITRKMFTSKDVWKLVSGVAVAVFVITLIYARFIGVEKDSITQQDKHKADIELLQNRIDKQNLRLVAQDNKLEKALEDIEDDVVVLKLNSHKAK